MYLHVCESGMGGGDSGDGGGGSATSTSILLLMDLSILHSIAKCSEAFEVRGERDLWQCCAQHIKVASAAWVCTK